MSELYADFPKVFKPLSEPKRYKVFYGGRGGAKSWAFARELLIQAARKPLRILCAREIQNSIKESVHKLLSDQIESMGLSDYYQILQTEIRGVNGSEFIFEGLLRNADKIKSMEGIDICWVEEADRVSEASWDLLIPTIRKARSEIWVSFNPRLKHDSVYQRFILNKPTDAVIQKVSWRDNPWFPEELRREMEDLKKSDYEKYLHVWEGELKNFADGAIYAKQLQAIESHITSVPIIPTEEVNTFWDLGKSDQTAIWFHQRIGLEDRFIDFHQARGQDIDYYVKVIKNKGYNYGVHYLPHDVEHQILGLGNKTRKEMLESGGVKPIHVVPRIIRIEEGIEMVRKALASCWFDKDRCADGLECLKNYRYEFDERKQTYKLEPLHDWTSDAADAFRQFAQGYRVQQKMKPLKINTRYVV